MNGTFLFLKTNLTLVQLIWVNFDQVKKITLTKFIFKRNTLTRNNHYLKQ